MMVTACSASHILAYTFQLEQADDGLMTFFDRSCSGTGISAMAPTTGPTGCRPWAGGADPMGNPVYERVSCADPIATEPLMYEDSETTMYLTLIVLVSMALLGAVTVLGLIAGNV